jgi:hypothetical protein
MVEEPGITNGRDDRVMEHSGDNNKQSMDGCTMEPPDAMEYAVLPVAVATINPSPIHYITYIRRAPNNVLNE